jgi:hypothetical protein
VWDDWKTDVTERNIVARSRDVDNRIALRAARHP